MLPRQGIVFLAVLLTLASRQPLPSQADEKVTGTGQPVQRDKLGDPLPEGALFRLGTIRSRSAIMRYAFMMLPAAASSTP
jgi:hypothetical protein